ncbi:MAG: DUF502 domain-containing protein [Burkholderiaceae bacterium]
MSEIRKWLLAGLLVIVPVAITAWVLKLFINTLDQTLLILPAAWQPDALLGVHIPGFGVLLAFAIVLGIGAAASNFLGRKLVRWGDALLGHIPVVRSLYSGVKQVSDTLFSDSGNAFRKVLLVQYPREGCWSLAFQTGAPGGEVAEHLPGEHVSIYMPTTPNPSSGFFLMLPRAQVIELDMTIDEALKYIISMGVVVPPVHARPILNAAGQPTPHP